MSYSGRMAFSGSGKRITFQDGTDAGAVSVTLEWVTLRDTGEEFPVRYLITGWIPGTSKRPYEATIPACGNDDCWNGKRTPCSHRIVDNGRHSGQKVADWWKHHRTHCHGWHDGTVEALARGILATYGSAPAARSRAL